MIRNNIHQSTPVRQETTEGVFTMKDNSFTRLLHNLIREHGTYRHGSYAVDTDAFSFTDMRLLLSYFVSNDELVSAYKSKPRTSQLFERHLKDIQHFIDEECDTVYCEAMEEMGMTQRKRPDNGEIYWVRR
jgi:hypothetical protein